MADNVRESKLIVSADNRASRVLRKIGRDLAALGRRSGLAKVAREARMVGTAFGNLGRGVVRSMSRVKTAALLAGAALSSIGLGAAGIVAMGKAYASTVDEQAKFARQTGLSLNQLRRLNFVAGRQGVTQELLNSSLLAMTKRVGEAKNGTGALTTYLKKSNPALLEQVKASTSSAEAFDLLMQAAYDLKDPMERNAFLAAAFSRSGIEMGRIAELGAKGTRDMAKEADWLQGVLGKNAGPEAEAFSDALGDVNTAITSWRDAIAEKLLPVMTPLLKSLSEWIAANRELVAIKVGEWVANLGEWLKTVDWEKFGSDLKDAGIALVDMVKALGWAADKIGGPKGVLIALAGLTFAPVILGLGQLAVAFGRLGIAAAGLVGLGPLTIALGVVAGVGFLIWRNWKDVGPMFKDAGNQLVGAFGDIVKAAGDLFRLDFPAFANDLWSASQKIGQAMIDIGSAISAIVKNETGIDLAAIFTPLLHAVEDIGGAVVDLVKALNDLAHLDLSGFVTNMLAALDKVAAAINEVGKAANSLIKQLTGIDVGQTAKAYGAAVTKGGTGIGSVPFREGDAMVRKDMGPAAPGVFGVTTPAARALGGPVTAMQPYLVGEHGKELFVPDASGNILDAADTAALRRGPYKPGDLFRSGDAGAGQPAAAADGKIDIAVRFANPPAGTSAHADVKGKGVGRLTLNTGKSMATGLA